MTEKIQHFDAIFRLLKKQMTPYGTPIVSKKKRGIPETPFVTLISCLLSLRTKDEVTADASRRLLTKYHTPQQIVQLTEKQIETMIYPVGFYKTKARRIKDISQTLLEQYQGNVPDTLEELLRLK
ncbi:MAG: endonuclease III, partial [Candidatus Thermoplasmatota archaeon]